MPKHDKSPLGEFEVIQKYFTRHQANQSSPLILGVGDDCALLETPKDGSALAITTDMLVENRHFFENVDPESLGHKALAVNLSDLAAMGAKPIGFTLSLALPNSISTNADWLEKFSRGIYQLADAHQCLLIGGDTTAGPLTINITAIGKVHPQQALRRDQAKPDDDIWVSHEIGDARWALGHLRGEWRINDEAFAQVRTRLERPTPRVALGLELRAIAHAAIDISDGLLGDLKHILDASKCNASVWIDQVPVSAELQQQSTELRRLCALQGGDDYELCFTASPDNRSAIESVSKTLGLKLTRIGTIHATEKSNRSEPIIKLFDVNDQLIETGLANRYLKSFDHFR
jgi:thiamine-monophosphate kinase